MTHLWNHALFFKEGHNTKWLLDKIEGGLKIHTEIDHDPFDTFLLVFFLFKNEHVMVEELLETFVGVIDAQLFKSVEIENFETGNIEHTTEEVLW